MHKSEFELGVRVRDTVTGFTGIVVCWLVYLNGCEHYGVVPAYDAEKHAGKYPAVEYIDVGQLEEVDAGIYKQDNTIHGNVIPTKPPGGPSHYTPQK